MPLYCETGTYLSFLHEPLNTITNAAGLIAVFFIYRLLNKNGTPWYTYPLLALILASVVGSFFWHGLREGWALSLDTLPGIIALCFFAYLWAAELWNRWAGYSFVAALMLSAATLITFFDVPFMFRFFLPVTLFTSILIIGTFLRDRRIGIIALCMLGILVASAGLGTADMDLCC